jgi:hypothetical protein
VHISLDSAADVPDGQEVRLVLVPPAHVYDRRQGVESPAITWAADDLDRRGSGARVYRNMLVFWPPTRPATKSYRPRCATIWHGSTSAKTPTGSLV